MKMQMVISRNLNPEKALPHRIIAPFRFHFLKEELRSFSPLALLQHAKIAHDFRTRSSFGVGLLCLYFLVSGLSEVKTCFSCAVASVFSIKESQNGC